MNTISTKGLQEFFGISPDDMERVTEIVIDATKVSITMFKLDENRMKVKSNGETLKEIFEYPLVKDGIVR